MRSFAADLGEKPTQKQMRLEGPYSINAYKRAFGSWNEAVAAAGFEPRQGSNPIPQKDLLNDLQQLADDLGRTPTQAEVREQGEYSVGAYYTHFGSLNTAKEKLELKLNKENNVERVSVECAWCGKELERLPSNVADNEYTYCSQDCLNQHKQERYSGEGNPRATLVEVECEACGTSIKRPRWKREANDRHFCDYGCMGAWRERNITAENHPQWKDFSTLECEWCGKSYSVKPSEQ